VTKELCVIGDFAWDVLIRTNTQLLRGGDTFGEVLLMPGGSAANVAVWAARRPPQPFHRQDRPRPLWLRQENPTRGVERHFVESDNHSTGAVAVFVDHAGERSMVSGHGADFYLLPSELPRGVITAANHLHLSGWSFFTDPPRSAAREAARLAHRAGATLSLDPASFQMIEEMGVDSFIDVTCDLSIDVLLPNKQEGAVLTGLDDPEAIAHRLAELYPGALVIVKLDADGALVLADDVRHIPPGPNKLVDATGAGDSFAGAFLAHYLKSGDVMEAATFATLLSSWVIEHIGARPAPDARLDRLIAQTTSG
jgi:ribokinase